jgi:hypothetical protein
MLLFYSGADNQLEILILELVGRKDHGHMSSLTLMPNRSASLVR